MHDKTEITRFVSFSMSGKYTLSLRPSFGIIQVQGKDYSILLITMFLKGLESETQHTEKSNYREI
jgi:hypothetical protein